MPKNVSSFYWHAFDQVWKKFILDTLKHVGVQGYILAFIEQFLTQRTFRFRNGDELSNEFLQENGVHSGVLLAFSNFLFS